MILFLFHFPVYQRLQLCGREITHSGLHVLNIDNSNYRYTEKSMRLLLSLIVLLLFFSHISHKYSLTHAYIVYMPTASMKCANKTSEEKHNFTMAWVLCGVCYVCYSTYVVCMKSRNACLCAVCGCGQPVVKSINFLVNRRLCWQYLSEILLAILSPYLYLGSGLSNRASNLTHSRICVHSRKMAPFHICFEISCG